MKEHPVVSPLIYYRVFGALMVLTFLTVSVAFVNLGPFNTVMALTIAVVKALLVILFFMHVIYASDLTKVFAAAGFFWFIILIVFIFSDFLTRGW